MNKPTNNGPSEALKQWQEQGKTIQLLGREMFYVDQGDSNLPTLLLIHGFPTASWDWVPMLRSLKGRYRIVTMDMLGFGFSDKPNVRNYSIHLQADFFEALIGYLELEQFHVLAHDYGDTVAQELLARQNERGENKSDDQDRNRWLSCCFLNGGLFPETHRALFTQKLLLSPIGGLFNRLMGKNKFNRAFSKVFGVDTKPIMQELDDFWFLINYKNGKHLFHNLMSYINDRIQHRARWVDALKSSIVPIAVINGSADPVSGAHMVKRYQELGCRLDFLCELGPIGHYPHVEAPTEVAKQYTDFLQGLV
jgi:pimeloyl-ACP methyl ester carboxylesterase